MQGVDGAQNGAKASDQSEEGRRLRSHNVTGPPDNIPVVHYKEGEPLDLKKHFTPKTGQGRSVKVIIPAQALGNTNRQVQSRQIWGSDVYTYDSDIVAILMHSGYYSHALSAPPASVTEAQVTSCWLVTKDGEMVSLQAAQDGLPAIAPTFMPAAMERTVHTRSSGTHPDRGQRMKQEVTIQYNLCNEPWLKYNMGAIADQGLSPSQWTSARLHSEVLYLETHSTRYELSRLDQSNTDAGATQEELFCWARCHKPMSIAHLKRTGVPLPKDMVDVIEPALPWEDFQVRKCHAANAFDSNQVSVLLAEKH